MLILKSSFKFFSAYLIADKAAERFALGQAFFPA